jgi:hypothetical protein
LNFGQFSPAVIWSGVAALAIGLYLLQRLRVRFRQVDIVTTLFWRQAQEENRTRVLTQRFRHLWVYLLLLAIASMMWFAAGALDWNKEGQRDYLLVLDGSLAMTEADVWQAAVDEVYADAAALPHHQREVWLAQTPPLMLLQKGEHERLLQERLAAHTASMQSSELSALLHRFSADPLRRKPSQVRIYGHARISENDSALLPVDLELVYRSPWRHLPNNRGIVHASWHETASGQWDRVDFSATVYGTTEPWQITVAGAPLTQPPTNIANADGTTTLWFRDLATQGETLLLQLPGDDGFSADNAYSCTLPQRQPIAVHVANDVAARIATVIEADPSLHRVEAGQAEVVIRTDLSPPSTLPQVVLTTADTAHAIQVQSASFASAEQLLAAAVPALGIHQIDGLALAESMDREVSLGATAEGTPQVQLWQALLNPEHGFVHSQSFPQFFSRTVRWLGMPAISQNQTSIGQGRTTTSQANPATALDANATLRLSQLAPTAEVIDPLSEERGWPLWNWLILLVFGLLLVEWAWFQQGRLP